ncbi:MAG TPA: alpha/beta fold hydrolase [Solirubrobacteraceae bacterium]|nr:alpha/beta fold hydrolase [Solirubrobacteraceae bacterium]
MPFYDLPAGALERHDPRPAPPADFDAFWARTLEETRAHPLDPRRAPARTPLRAVETFDVSFAGFGGDRIYAWLHLPAARSPERLPAVVRFQGYGGGRGLPWEHVFWAAAGYAELVVDTRGQGAGWTRGDTPDPHGAGPSQPGFLTRGLADPERYYYRRAYADVVRALEFVHACDGIDPDAVAVSGASQGGAFALAAAALAGDAVAAALVDVPFLCDIRRASEISPSEPYGELARYLAQRRDELDRAFATLAYFDGVVLAQRAGAPALFSVALMDEVCPPSTVYAAYNAYEGPKEIAVYPYNDHEGGEAFHLGRQAEWLAGVLGEPPG